VRLLRDFWLGLGQSPLRAKRPRPARNLRFKPEVTKLVKLWLTFRASAIALAPSSPMPEENGSPAKPTAGHPTLLWQLPN
jgi:hypothetical protein